MALFNNVSLVLLLLLVVSSIADARASCGCDKMMPPTCWCTYEVDACSPSECPVNTVTVLENLLAYNIGN
ncbi:hypothetical protein TIFTF001_030072 [Ficus carica]|uniref:Uncharacterized protein n=1 Tax=Ficus carica TaxID=3494 RepID=A0AA88DWW7_FICCA|nr:hypothetical protein TIFTF001_030072 [Ficus carica]